MSPTIRNLEKLDPEQDLIFGGKAHGLARLLAAGARVPPGFAVAAGTEVPSDWPTEEREALAAAAHALLDAGPVAVRSSALGEDSAERSFAGLFETVLDVACERDLLEAAEHCIASGAGARVLIYSPGGSPLPVGLVVQRMIAARTAGVCFTRDPIGADGAVVIEAVEGSGDDLVGGRAEPDRWRAYRSGLGGWECRAESCGGVLDETAVSAIAQQASGLREALGEELDLEWALDEDGELWWLQARPITALHPAPSYEVSRSYEDADDGPVTLWSNWNVRETMPDPMLPLTWSIWREVIMPVVLHQVAGLPRSSRLNRRLAALDLVHGRIYFNMNGLLAAPLLGRLTRRALAVIDKEADEVVRALIAAGVLRPRRVPGSPVLLTLRMVAAGAAGLIKFTRALRPRAALRTLERVGWAAVDRPPVGRLSDEQLVADLRLLETGECRPLLDGLQMEVAAMAVYAAARWVFRHYPEAAERLATGIPANPTTRISLAIDELVAAARSVQAAFLGAEDPTRLLEQLWDEPQGREWLERLGAFLDLYGHRGPMEFDIGAPRWRDDPSMIVELVRAGLRSSAEAVPDRMARLGREREESLAAAVAASSRWRRPLLRRMARLVELYMPLREAPKHWSLLVFDRSRRAALELGDRLTRTGALADAEEVFFLELGELEALARGLPAPPDLSDRIAERRSLHHRFLAEQPPDFLRSDDVPVEVPSREELEDDGKLHGVAVSAGCARGPVRVLTTPDPAAMHDGDVLVMRSADPGWTPLFPRTAAVVVEVGGLMCHAAVVAREMGVPAVFGIRNATRILRDDDTIEVDGARGTVAKI